MAIPTPPSANEVLATINSVPARKRLYAPSGSATIDNTFVDACILEAWSELHALTSRAYPNGLRNPDGSLDPFLFGWTADGSHAKAAGRHLNATDGSGYARAWERAKAGATALDKAAGLRPTQGAGEPVASVAAYALPSADQMTSTWADIADGRTRGGF